MKTLLICPAIRPAVPQLAEEGPLAIAPILGECVVSHWIEHVVSLGARHVRVIAADRADHVREALGDGSRWGVHLEVIATHIEPTAAEAVVQYQQADKSEWLSAPHDTVVMNHLPGCPDLPLFESYSGWFAALLAWIPRAITPTRVRLSELRPGIWVSRRARISSTAELIAPCWIGDQAFVESGAVVGPSAILEERSVVADDAQVKLSWVGPATFVGPMTSVSSSLAWGSSLTNWRSDSSLRVPDPFLLCSLAPPRAVKRPDPIGASVQASDSSLTWLTGWPPPVRRVQGSQPPA